MKQYEIFSHVPRNKTRLEQVKEQHGIETHDSELDEEGRWMAILMPAARQLGKPYGVTDKSDLFDVVSKVCRLLDEAGYIAQASTERDAVLELCRLNGIGVVL